MSRPAITWHGHASLRFDANPEKLAEFLVDVILSYGLTLLTTTESRSSRLVRALRRRLPKGYHVTRRYEYLIVWHASTYRGHWLAWLGKLDPRQFAMLGGHRLFRVARKRLRHVETGTRLRVEVAHAPSGVNAGAGKWNARAHPDRVRISRAGFTRWGHRTAHYKRRHPDAAVALHMDSNLNLFREQWRHYLDHELGAPSVWTLAGLPAHGSHGLQLIDTAQVLGLEVDLAGVVDRHRPPKLDHDPVVYRAAYTNGDASDA